MNIEIAIHTNKTETARIYSNSYVGAELIGTIIRENDGPFIATMLLDDETVSELVFNRYRTWEEVVPSVKENILASYHTDGIMGWVIKEKV